MKILHLPLQVEGSFQIGQRRGMQEVFGEENVVEFDYLNHPNPNEELIKIASQGFDVCWFQLQETNTITSETLEKIKPYVKVMTHWTGDIRTVVPNYLQQISPLFDITYIAMKGHIPMYQQFCGDVRYMPIAVDPEEVNPPERKLDFCPEIVFIGNHYGEQFPDSKERLELFGTLTRRFPNFGVYGGSWSESVRSYGQCPLKDQIHYYRQAKVCISINHFNKVEQYYSERLLWCLASGTPCLVKYFPGVEKEFRNIITFNTYDECGDLCQKILESPESYQDIADRAKEEVLQYHHWGIRFQQLKKDVEEKQCLLQIV